MEVYRASELSGRLRAEAWNAIWSTRLGAAAFLPAAPETFEAELRLGELGPIRLARLRCDAGTIQRPPNHVIVGPQRVYAFVLQARGSGVLTHYGHQTILDEGDFTLCDSAAPHSLVVAEEAEQVIIRVPAKLLREHLPSPEHFCGRHLSAAAGATHTAQAMTLSLCEQLEMGLVTDLQSRIARHLLDLLATSYAIALDSVITGSSVISSRHANVKLYIEQHLRDPDLSPCSVAGALRLSARYLRMIFATGNETVSAYILRRRLEECARQMADPRWRSASITEIAFAWGFNSASHFTRSFRERYDMSPRDYRRRRLDRDIAPAPAC